MPCLAASFRGPSNYLLAARRAGPVRETGSLPCPSLTVGLGRPISAPPARKAFCGLTPKRGAAAPKGGRFAVPTTSGTDNDHPKVVAASPSNFGVAGKREDTDCQVCLSGHEGRVEIDVSRKKILERSLSEGVSRSAAYCHPSRFPLSEPLSQAHRCRRIGVSGRRRRIGAGGNSGVLPREYLGGRSRFEALGSLFSAC